MKLTLERPHFAVFDDFLPKAQLAEVQHHLFNEARLEFINKVEHLSVFSLDDGHPLAAPVIVADPKGSLMRTGEGSFYPHPIETGIDHVLEAVLGNTAKFAPWIGTKWRTVTSRAFVYPQGTGLDWHDDGGQYTGAFSFYVHPSWQPQWGGELLIALGKGGEFSLPIPNRLVILKGNTPHKIARVSSSAGSNHRMSVSGFFAKADAETFSDGTLSYL